jgi:Flp pilus assembly protein TadG
MVSRRGVNDLKNSNMLQSPHLSCRFRHGSAAVEFAVLLPLLALIALGAVDMGRFSYAFISVASAARNGAQIGSKSPTAALNSTGIATAAKAEMSSIHGYSSSNPTVTSTRIDEGSGDYSVRVTVTFQFSIISKFPLLPQTLSIVRTVHMRVVPV